ncbi:MAG: N-6 DNA methylase, partial [Gemmataceae bacterium]|nr:N-6 DNA methylase [Gemmataceae bacterium]
MARKRAGKPPLQNGLDLLARTAKRRIRPLILPRLLAAEADNMRYRGEKQDRAFAVLQKWASLEEKGHLKRKETSLDADFLQEVFDEGLGYKRATESPEQYQQERAFTLPGVGTADGALGQFKPSQPLSPVAIIELKGADTDLDRDKFNGRTPVQQCWDYLNALPDCPWGIVSNFVSFRLYHRNKTPLSYQEFRLQDLLDLDVFRQFWCLFEYGGLLSTPLGGPRALRLLSSSESRQREVGGQLYQTYSDNRYQLIEHLHFKLQKPLDQAIHIAQKIIDRIIFVAFCEDRGLLPERCIHTAYSTLPPFTKVTNPRWRNFLDLFHAIDKGHNDLLLETGYNGGLFRHDDDVDNLQLDDSWTTFFKTIGEYDFRDEVNVEVLGNLFERSISELEKLRQAGLFTPTPSDSDELAPSMPKSPERKRFGIFYTPLDFTGYIVQHTVGGLVKERWFEIRQRLGVDPKDLESDQPNPAAKRFWEECFEELKQIKILDPACGSGAFLIQSYDQLEDRYEAVVEQLVFHDGVVAETLFDQIPDLILSENLFGVDLSEQGVEITQLALWLRSARRGKSLADLSQNILRRNCLVSDPAVHSLAMDWKRAFPAVFARPQAAFDCVVGNPPWERLKLQEREFFAFSAPTIAGAVSAARRRQLIDKLRTGNPELFARYTQAKDDA